MKKHILSVLVANKAGVLSRISGLFSRRGFNIHSLAVGTTNDETVSRITIVVIGDEYIVDQVTKQLNKLIDVIKIKRLMEEDTVSRELALIKVAADNNNRSGIVQIVDIFRANIIDVSHKTITIEITGSSEKLQAIIDLLAPFEIKEMVKTGMISIERGTNIINE
ncbi:MAG: acetolactate synthase small subunit [Clostridiaceae bacterium]|nr:acetolactate synthase small subunit [Clostridiaceae bacterium]